MILGVPLGILTGLWVTWNGAKLVGGGWWTAGICLCALILAATGGGILLRNRMPARIALGLTLLGLAIGLLRGVASDRNTENEALVQVLPDITTVRGSVTSDPVPRGTTQDVPVHVDAVVTKDGRWLAVSGELRVMAPVSTRWTQGDGIEASGTGRGLGGGSAIFHARTTEQIHGSSPGVAIAGTAHAWRQSLVAPILRYLPEPEASLAVGILLGDRNDLPPWLSDAFRMTGASHLIAISGYNVSIVAGATTWLAGLGGTRRTARWRVIRAVIVSVALWMFVALVGASGSVLRAGTLTQLLVVAYATGRRGAVAGALLWGSVALAGWSPSTLDDVGWQLSFLGTAGLVWLAPTFDRWLIPQSAGATTGSVATLGRLVRAPFAIIPLREAISATAGAQVFVLPVIAGTLGNVPLLGVAATIPGIILIPPIMLASVTIATVGYVWSASGAINDAIMTVLAVTAWTPTTLLIRLVEWSASLPGAAMPSTPWSPVWVTVYLVGLVLLGVVAEMTPRQSATRQVAGLQIGWRPGAITLCIVAILMIAMPELGNTRTARASTGGPLAPTTGASAMGERLVIPHFDGSPDAVMAMIAIPGGPRMVIGGGPTIEGAAHAVGVSLRPWDRAIDTVVIPSNSEAAGNGLARLLHRYPTGAVLKPENTPHSFSMDGITTEAARYAVPVLPLGSGQAWQVSISGQGPASGRTCPPTGAKQITVTFVGPLPSPTSSSTVTSTFTHPLAIRACTRTMDITVVPDIRAIDEWIAHATSEELNALDDPSGNPRLLLVPLRARSTDALVRVRNHIGPAMTILQGGQLPWQGPPSPPLDHPDLWHLTAIHGPVDTAP